jgi:hypothetical protein
MNLQKGPTPGKGKQNCVNDVSVFEERGGGDFKINAADIFSFDPIPTRAKNAWSSSTCLLYAVNVCHDDV